MAKENKSQFALLGILSLGPHTGYEIKKLIERSLIHFWREGYGQIYPNLKRLVEQGLATKKTEEQEGRPNKHVYTITEKGKKALRQWLVKPIDQLPVEKNELLLKLFFGANVSIEENRAHIERYRADMMQTLDVYEGIEKYLTSDGCEDEDTEYFLLTLRYGQRVTRSIIEWCDESLSVLNNRSEGRPDRWENDQ